MVVDVWFERDRASVIVYENEERGEPLLELWDEDVHQAIEDGFLARGPGLKQSAIEYAKYLQGG